VPLISSRSILRAMGLAVALVPAVVACAAPEEDAADDATSAVTARDAGPDAKGDADADAGPLPPFHGAAAVLDAATRASMTGVSYKSGCPVGLDQLRLLTLDHWGFDGEVHVGRIVAHEDQAAPLLRAFEAIFVARYPIARMQLVDAYGGNDDMSMAADNTSSFNCRPKTGQSTGFSEHSYGRAIDINPVRNPYVTSGGTVSPPTGARYAKRSLKEPGMIQPNDAVVRAFVSIGWKWGGAWSGARDYQHFSLSGL